MEPPELNIALTFSYSRLQRAGLVKRQRVFCQGGVKSMTLYKVCPANFRCSGRTIAPKASAGLGAVRTFSCTSTFPWKICHQERILLDGLTVWQCHLELFSAVATNQLALRPAWKVRYSAGPTCKVYTLFPSSSS